ncbi:hypothetical protein ACFSTE_10450 [Aquimarina hainanensis]|uniref:Uracil-DNA glycosylase-like domain-containing protein n=1 Tax=Aquimarina hainanensis TaxID=1578017 RepID=A0ABW5N8F4_9FLAO|nr:hypothetical protein [Aquimarina sp. TRL1]QKX05735.1 hypothetical protein HN014_12715 [Aquimarina sp. TRL1]
MDTSELNDFKEFVKSTLGETAHKSGTLLYSHARSLKKGKFLMIGLNPGGDPHAIPTTILESLTHFETDNYRPYVADWENGKTHRFKKNLETIGKILNMDLQELCITHLFMYRTYNKPKIDKIELEKSLAIIDRIIKIVDPEIIITFGKLTFEKIKEHYYNRNYSVIDTHDESSGQGRWVIKSSYAFGINKVKFIGLPHLNTYTIYNKPSKIAWLEKQVETENTYNIEN